MLVAICLRHLSMGVIDCFPSAEITFDRFHILKNINEAVDKVKREEVKRRLKAESVA